MALLMDCAMSVSMVRPSGSNADIGDEIRARRGTRNPNSLRFRPASPKSIAVTEWEAHRRDGVRRRGQTLLDVALTADNQPEGDEMLDRPFNETANRPAFSFPTSPPRQARRQSGEGPPCHLQHARERRLRPADDLPRWPP